MVGLVGILFAGAGGVGRVRVVFVEPAVLILGRINQGLAAVQGQLVAQLQAAVTTLDHGLHLEEEETTVASSVTVGERFLTSSE